MRIAQRIGAILIAGALSLSLAGAAVAQGGRGARAQTIPQTWLNRLNLNDEQKAKVKTATDAYRAELQTASSLTGQERRQASRKARETYESAVNGTLNAEQSKQLNAFKEEAKQYEGMGQAANAMVGLNLTDEQKTKVKAIGAKYQPELMKLRQEQRSATDRQAIQQQITAANQKMMEEIKAVLTPDQIKQLPPPGRRRRQQQ